jgi:excinuclease UvrABC ATPase subunit
MPIAIDTDFITVEQLAKRVTDMGFVRYQIADTAYSVADTQLDIEIGDVPMYIVVDRLIRKMDADFDARLTDSLRIALEKGDGRVAIYRE